MRYGDAEPVVEGATLAVRAGEVASLVGPPAIVEQASEAGRSLQLP